MNGSGEHRETRTRPNDPGADLPPDERLSPEDLAALYAAGAMDSSEVAQFEHRLTASAEYRMALQSFDAATAALFECIEPVEPRAKVRATLLDRIAHDLDAKEKLPESQASRPLIHRATADAWRPSPIPGISMRILHIDRAARRFSGLFHMEVGAVYPSHSHNQPEEILVLEGDLDFGNYSLGAGDYLRLEAGTTHTEARTQRGCVCLITAEMPESLVA